MSYVTLDSAQFWPPQIHAGASSANFLIDASTEKACCIFRVPVTGTLDGFEVLLGTVTQAPASGLKFSFQDVDVSSVPGVPDGTADQSSTVTVGITSNAWLASGTMTRSVTRGDILACVIEYASWASGDSLNITRRSGLDISPALPYCGLYTGSWAMQLGGMAMALRYSGGAYYPIEGMGPWITTATFGSAFGSGSSPDEYASKIVLPYGVKSHGFVVWLDSDSACDVVLYDSVGNVVGSKTISPNLRQGANVGGAVDYWSSTLTLAAGTYYLTAKPTSASTVRVSYLDVSTAAIMGAAPGGVGGGILATRTDAGAWSTTATRRMLAQLMISDIDVGGLAPQMRITGPRPTSRR